MTNIELNALYGVDGKHIPDELINKLVTIGTPYPMTKDELYTALKKTNEEQGGLMKETEEEKIAKVKRGLRASCHLIEN